MDEDLRSEAGCLRDRLVRYTARDTARGRHYSPAARLVLDALER